MSAVSSSHSPLPAVDCRWSALPSPPVSTFLSSSGDVSQGEDRQQLRTDTILQVSLPLSHSSHVTHIVVGISSTLNPPTAVIKGRAALYESLTSSRIAMSGEVTRVSGAVEMRFPLLSPVNITAGVYLGQPGTALRHTACKQRIHTRTAV